MEPAAPGTKPCPYCMQPVLAGAIKCRWCGEMIPASPGAAPTAPAPYRMPPPVEAQPAIPVGAKNAAGMRPMTVVQILDASFRLYRENFALFLGITAIVYVPVVMGALALQAWTLSIQQPGRGAALPFQAEFATALVGLQAGQPPNLAQVLALCGVLIIWLAIYALAVPIADGALTRAVSDRYVGLPTSIGSAYRVVFRIFFPYLLTSLLVGLLFGISFFLCIIPMFVLIAMFAFVSQIMVVENVVGTDAMGRSVRLSEGHRWRAIGLLHITLLVRILLFVGLSLSSQFLLSRVIDSEMTRVLVEGAVGNIIGLLLQPLFSVAWVLFYYDVRIRKEGFDLQLLAQRAPA